ncbi:MAG: oligosaccharide flippase family protein [Pseudomonadota bacterium]
MLRPFLSLFSGAAAGQAIVFAAAPILTRIYSPDEFGVLGIFSSYLAILTLVACLRFELAIPLPKSNRDAWQVLALCMLLVAALSVLLAVLVFVAGDRLLPIIGAESIGPYAWLFPVALFFSAGYQAASQLALRYREYGTLASTRIMQASLGAFTQISAGLVGLSILGLLIGQTISVGSGSLRLARVLSRKAPDLAKELKPHAILAVAKRYASFAWFGSPAALLNGLALHLPTILIGSLYDPITAGQFFLAQRVLNLPLLLFSSAVSQSYMGEASELLRSGVAGINKLFWKLAMLLAALALLGSLCVYYLSPILFGIVFGEAWSTSGVFASLLACYLGFRFVTTSLAPTLIIFERQDLSLIVQILSALAVIVSFGLAWHQDLPAVDTVLLYSLSMTVPYIFGLYFIYRTVATHALRQ